MEQLTKNQAVATSQEAVQNQNEPQLRDENAHNDKSVHGVLNPTYQAGLRRDAVQPDIEEIGRAVQQECQTDLVCRLLLEKKKKETTNKPRLQTKQTHPRQATKENTSDDKDRNVRQRRSLTHTHGEGQQRYALTHTQMKRQQ